MGIKVNPRIIWFQVYNIKTLKMVNDINFKESEDHSKWAVTTSDVNGGIVCIGDINRMVSTTHTWHYKFPLQSQ